MIPSRLSFYEPQTTWVGKKKGEIESKGTESKRQRERERDQETGFLFSHKPQNRKLTPRNLLTPDTNKTTACEKPKHPSPAEGCRVQSVRISWGWLQCKKIRLQLPFHYPGDARCTVTRASLRRLINPITSKDP